MDSNLYHITNIIYKAKITSNLQNYHRKNATEREKAHLNIDMETAKNNSITKNIVKIQNL